jgi:hypothetical protein
VPSWQYVIASGRHTSGNLEFSLNQQAGVPLRVVMTDATCSEMPEGPGAPPCVAGSGTGVLSWTRSVALRQFTLESAHLSGDLSACHGGEAFHGCLIGTFGAYEPPIPFDDIVGTKFFDDVVWAFENGITTGCSRAPPLYCPNDHVTRGQMATLLDRALDPPTTDVDFFTDDTRTSHHGAINRIAAAGITTGCKPTLYCPKDPVTRGQMATFLDRALGLAPTEVDFFSDDDGIRHEDAINRVAAAGITSGCGTERYCPKEVVKRGQMAALLHRALGD